MDAEKSAMKLETAIKATGMSGKISSKNLAELAAQLQEVTRFEDDATIAAMATLQMFGELDEKLITDLTPHVMDVAEALDVDLNQAAMMVAKTLDGSMNAFARYGIELDMTKSKTERAAQLTEQLEGKFGGLAKAMGETTEGKLAILANKWNDVMEDIGAVINEVLVPILGVLGDIIDAVGKVVKGFRDMLGAIKNTVEWIGKGEKEQEKMQNALHLTTKGIEAYQKATGEMLLPKNASNNQLIAYLEQAKGKLNELGTAHDKLVKDIQNAVDKNEVAAGPDLVSKFTNKMTDMYKSRDEYEKLMIANEQEQGRMLAYIEQLEAAITTSKKGQNAESEKQTEELLKQLDIMKERQRWINEINEINPTVQKYQGMGGYKGSEGMGEAKPKEPDMLSGLIDGAFGHLISNVENLGKLLDPITTFLDGFLSIIGGPLNDALQPLVNLLMQLGKIVGQLLLPVIQILGFVIKGVAAFIAMIFNGIATVINFLLGWAGVHIDYMNVGNLSQESGAASSGSTSGTSSESSTYSGGMSQSTASPVYNVTVNVYAGILEAGDKVMTTDDLALFIRDRISALAEVGK